MTVHVNIPEAICFVALTVAVWGLALWKVFKS